MMIHLLKSKLTWVVLLVAMLLIERERDTKVVYG
jgi:hypothetical protein